MWRGISYERTAFFQNTNPILNKTLVLQAITAVTTPLPFSSTLATADYHRTRHSSPIKKYSVTTCSRTSIKRRSDIHEASFMPVQSIHERTSG